MAQALPPGLAGFIASQQAAQQGTLANLQQAGTLAQLTAAADKKRQEEAYRQSLAAATTPEEQLAVATRFAGPETLAKSLQAHQDRVAQREQAAAALRERLAAQAQSEREKREAAAAALQAQLQSRRDMLEAAASLRQPAAPTITEIADPADPTKAIKIDARTGRVIGASAPKPKVERALPAPLQKQLTEAAELADATDRFRTTFKDSFGGKTITGELTNVIGRILGDDTGQSQWWQDYELHQSQVRNKLFGSALTAPEIEAWNKSAINPRMDPAQIRANIARRNSLETRALERLVKGASAGGYNREQIEAFTGRGVPGDGQPAAPTPNRMRFDAQGNPL